MPTGNPTIRHPGKIRGSAEETSTPPSPSVRALSAVALGMAFYGLLVALTLAYALSVGSLGS